MHKAAILVAAAMQARADQPSMCLVSEVGGLGCLRCIYLLSPVSLGLQLHAHPAPAWAFNRTFAHLLSLGLQLHADPAAQAGPSIER